MGEEFYLVCIDCKEKLWVGKYALCQEEDVELHKFLIDYLGVLRFIDRIWHSRFINLELLEKFIKKHGDIKHHFLRIIGDEEDVYDKFRDFKEVKK